MDLVNLSKKDTPRLVEIDRLAFADYDMPAITAEQLEKTFSNGFVLGVKESGQLVSDIQIEFRKGSVWYCCGLATLPEHAGKGLASILLGKVLERAKTEKVKRISCTIRPTNETSIHLFKKYGFKETAFLKDHFGKGIDRLLLELKL